MLGTRNAVDLTIERTIYRQAKCKGGIVGFSQNVAVYHRWCMTRHKRASFVTALLEESGLDSQDQTHKDSQPSQIRQSEKSVRSVQKSFETFINPFDDVGNNKLISLSSGMEATEKVTADLLSIEKDGKLLYENFVKTTLAEKSHSFHAPLKRTKKGTFALIATQQKTVKLKTAKKQEVKITAQRNMFG